MEGNLQVAPGAILEAGYDFTIPGHNNPIDVTFTSPEVTFTNVTCANGTALTTGTITVPTQTATCNSTNGGAWYPSGDQSSPLVYQGSLSVPDICKGLTSTWPTAGPSPRASANQPGDYAGQARSAWPMDRHGGVRYATRMQLSAEERLLAQAQAVGARSAPASRSLATGSRGDTRDSVTQSGCAD
jgi:hypothetical protein